MNVVLRKWKKEDAEPLAILANNKNNIILNDHVWVILLQ
jgi:hypothetical protein